jgi:hypothetical protein
MNYVKHLKDIENKLFRKDRFGGCYVYSEHQNDKAFKLGMSEASLFARVKQAKFCFPLPNTFFIHLLIICHNKKNIRPLEKKLLAESKELKKITVSTDDGIPEQGIRSTEYRITTDRTSLGNAVKTVLAENRTLWDEVVVFGKTGWKIYTHSIKSLAVSKSVTQHAIQYVNPLKVGDFAYVIYPDMKGKPVISAKGKITKKIGQKWEIHWDKYEGKPYTSKYPFNEAYKLKKEATEAIKYWY